MSSIRSSNEYGPATDADLPCPRLSYRRMWKSPASAASCLGPHVQVRGQRVEKVIQGPLSFPEIS